MGRTTCNVLRTVVFVAATLYLSGCAYGPSSTKSLPGGTLSAAKNAASGPLLATWWDAGQEGLRTVYGVLGAAHEGALSFNDGTYSGAATCMRKNFALLSQSSGSLLFVSLPDGSPALLSGNSSPKASIIFSPSCSTALVYTPGVATALLVQGLLTAPAMTTLNLSASTSVAAVADSGSVLMALPAANGGATIQLLASSNNSLQPITTVSGFGGMTFLPGADTALVADAVANTISEVSYISGVQSLTTIANGSSGVSKPLAIAVSGDGRFAAVANQQDSSVLRLDLTGQSPPAKTICRCSPTRLEPLVGNFAFRVTEPGTGTVWAFDGDSAEPRLLFLPSSQSISTAKGARR